MRNLFVVFLFMWLSPIAHATSCSLVIPETLPENSNTLKEFQKWIKTSKEFSYLSESEIKPFELDLNNDGKKELVLPLLQGSGGYLYIETFQKGASGFTSFGSPPPPVGVSSEGGWLTHACFRPKLPGSKTGSQYREVFFYQCGSDTYFTMSGDRLGECPVYIWKDKSVSRVCGDAIRERELDGAKAVYDLKDYPMSTNILNDYYQNCAKVMTDDQKLRFLSDLSLSYAKLKDQGECATTLKTATAIPSFKDSKFKSSITHNSELCAGKTPLDSTIFESAIHHDLTPDLVQVTVPSAESLTIDHRSKAWIMAGAIPGASARDHASYDLRQLIIENTGEPCYQKDVTEKRYVSYFGCRAHSATDRAGVWVDTQTHQSIFFSNTSNAGLTGTNCHLAGSRTLNGTHIPPEFWKVYQKFKKFSDDKTDSAFCFISEQNGETTLESVTPLKLEKI